MIEAEGLTKKFGGVTAVQGLTLNVEKGEVFGFLGPNGAGKDDHCQDALAASYRRPAAKRRSEASGLDEAKTS